MVQVYKLHKCTGTSLANLRIEMYWYKCYNIDTVRERLLSGGKAKGSEVMQPMTNEQSKRLEELVKENAKLKAKVKSLKKKLKKKK